MINIQFIVVGWHYSYPEWIEGLIELNKSNENLDVFWSCHKEPPDVVKQNFNWKLFENIGLEEGAYTQALEYLDVDDDTILFLVHDDLIIKDWNFINVSIEALNTHGLKVLGNGVNYPTVFDPEKIERDKKNIEWVSASRLKREKYALRGSDGKMDFKMGPLFLKTPFPYQSTSKTHRLKF